MIKSVLLYLIQIVNFMILGRVIMSWISRDYRNPIVRFFNEVTEPILAPIRNLMDRIGLGGGMLDFSPIVAFLLLNVLTSVVVRL